jgi:hypothetical protein
LKVLNLRLATNYIIDSAGQFAILFSYELARGALKMN